MKLPSVYANKIEKVIKNNTEYYRGDREIKKDLRELKDCFDSRGYANRLIVELDTKNGSRTEKLVLCKNNYFININNEKIYFEDIMNYTIKK